MIKSLHLKKETKQKEPELDHGFQPCNIPPLFIVNAIRDYQAINSEEISMEKGDFLHVTDDKIKPGYYQVCNPLTNKLGFAPVRMFNRFDKHARIDEVSGAVSGTVSGTEPTRHTLGTIDTKKANEKFTTNSQPPPQKIGVPLHEKFSSAAAIALYTFNPERSDELGFDKGSRLIVVAKSTQDWFVAKLEGTNQFGLVPSAYLQLLDKFTGKVDNELANKLPSVTEWQKMTEALPKKSPQIPPKETIPTVTIQRPQTPGFNTLNSDYGTESSSCSSSSVEFSDSSEPPSPCSPLGTNFPAVTNSKPILDVVRVNSFISKHSDYFYIINLNITDKGVQHTLYRNYDDFYAFHTDLMSHYPIEAGKTGEPRVIPLMPGPVPKIDKRVAKLRMTDLDLYLQQLFLLPSPLVEYALKSNFFALRGDDLESPLSQLTPIPPRTKSGSLKVKVKFNEEIIVFKLPPNATNFDLQQKICDRYGDAITALNYKDAKGELWPLDLSVPLSNITRTQSGKLLIYAS